MVSLPAVNEDPQELEARFAATRADFPILDQKVHGHPLIYLDNAASSQKPEPVLQAMYAYYRQDHANVHRGIHELSNRATEAYENSRKRAATFLNARSESEIIFTRGTTEGINLVASSLGVSALKEGDVVLLTEMEHHSNLVPWQILAQRKGIRLRFIPVTGDEGLLDLDAADRLLNEEVKLVSLTHISNTLGTVNPVTEICRKAREVGALSLVDAAQSAGHLQVDVQSIGCDFLAFSGHKICGPTGIGVLYGRSERLEALEPYQGGGEMITRVTLERSWWNRVPHKFEAGTPNMAGAIGLAAALDYLDGLGRPAIWKHDGDLAEYAYQRLQELGNVRLFGPPAGRAGLVSFVFQDVDAYDLVTLADQRGLALRGGHHCNQPLMDKLGVPATARMSFYFYNTREEVDRAMDVLRHVRRLVTGS